MKNSMSTENTRSEVRSIDTKLMASYVVVSALFLVAVYGLSAHPDIGSTYEVLAAVSP